MSTVPLVDVSAALGQVDLPPSVRARIRSLLRKASESHQKGKSDATLREKIYKELGFDFDNHGNRFNKLGKGHSRPRHVSDVHRALRRSGEHIGKKRLSRIINSSLTLPKAHKGDSIEETSASLLQRYVQRKYGGKRPNLKKLFADITEDHPEWFNIGRGRGLSKHIIERWIHDSNEDEERIMPYVLDRAIERLDEERREDPTSTRAKLSRPISQKKLSLSLNGRISRRKLRELMRARSAPTSVAEPSRALTEDEINAVMTYVYYDKRMMFGRDRLTNFFKDMDAQGVENLFKEWVIDSTKTLPRGSGVRGRELVGADDREREVETSGSRGTSSTRATGRESLRREIKTPAKLLSAKKQKPSPDESMPTVLGGEALYPFGGLTPEEIAGTLRRSLNTTTVMAWLRSQEVHQMFFPSKPKHTFAPTVLGEPYSQVAIDLISLEFAQSDGQKLVSTGGYVFVLTGIDLFSKRAYAVPLPNKSSASIVAALVFLFDRKSTKKGPSGFKGENLNWSEYPHFRQHPRALRSDNGTEFTDGGVGKFLEEKTLAPPSIFASFPARQQQTRIKYQPTQQIFSQTYTPQSNGAVERFNKFLKKQLNMFTMQTSEAAWVGVLPLILKGYNATRSRITNVSPDEVEELYATRAIPENEKTYDKVTYLSEFQESQRNVEIKKQLEEHRQAIIDAIQPQFKSLMGQDMCGRVKEGTLVRIKTHLNKSMGETWSRAVYSILSVTCMRGIRGNNKDIVPLQRPLVRVQLMGRNADGSYSQRPLLDPESSFNLVRVLLPKRFYLVEVDGVWKACSARAMHVVGDSTPLSCDEWTPVLVGQERGKWVMRRAPSTLTVSRATPIYWRGLVQEDVIPKVATPLREEDVNAYLELNGIMDRNFAENEVLSVDRIDNPLKSDQRFIVQRLVRPVLVGASGKVVQTPNAADAYLPYYLVKWAGYSELTKEPRSNLPSSIVKRFERANEVKWTFADKKFATVKSVSSKLDQRALSYKEKDTYGSEGARGGGTDEEANTVFVGDVVVVRYGAKKYVAQVIHIAKGNSDNAVDPYEETIANTKTSARKVHTDEWVWDGNSSFVLTRRPLQSGGKRTLYDSSDIEAVLKAVSYNATDDKLTINKNELKRLNLVIATES